MEYQKITNLLDATSDNVPRFISKKWIEVNDLSGDAENIYKPSKQIRFKTSKCYNEIYVITVMHILVLKELLMLQIQIIMHMIRN